ncbi:MAG: bifunctional alpha,alpha-trehalose-phosphate synthase (UDP-forming)/trehalose-phosphatase [Spirochaetia bacterium]|nr:bifunctional alpha,alpha-trehalose-phosphate synthase (UDP-forming)/trehalose-phosphatase [Spirochaetia bacterium]
MSNRLLIISNRLPVTVKAGENGPEAIPSSGGLSTGLKGPFEKSGGLWIGWPGDLSSFNDSEKKKIYKELDDLRLVPVDLTAEEIEAYYERFSNGVIWPLFHYLLHLLPVHFDDWDTYVHVNEKFAEITARVYRPGDIIWIHDYQLCLVPSLIRKKIPDARIGFFLHIPFPSSEVFRILPAREEILEGILGADLVGFHTFSYMRHFSSALVRISGKEPAINQVYHEGRHVNLGIFPISIDTKKFSDLARSKEVSEKLKEFKNSTTEEFIILGIDRLDYTKGIRRRLFSIERFFENYPEFRGRVCYIQVAVPTRENVEAYEEFRDEINRLVSEINGKYGTVNTTPIRYLYQSFDIHTVVSLYRAADVMLVTPIRDGMNLVAKEFVASRVDEDGVLILSEYAGASSELGEAVIVNPYDIDEVAEAIHSSIIMRPEEKRIRMKAMRDRVFAQDVHSWANSFIDKLESLLAGDIDTKMTSPNEIAEQIRASRGGKKLCLLLDYDGTLAPFQKRPELASPTKYLMKLLESLMGRKDFHVGIISGRKRETLEDWFGGTNLEIYAEHGLWERRANTKDWVELQEINTEWKETVRPLLDLFSRSTPGAFIEEKTASLAWHYRAAEKEFGAVQAKELMIHLLETYSNIPVQVLPGNKVIEIRMQGVNKGLAVDQLKTEMEEEALFVAIGDDHTDEDMFAALPENGISIRVGTGESIAKYRISSSDAVYDLLEIILKSA